MKKTRSIRPTRRLGTLVPVVMALIFGLWMGEAGAANLTSSAGFGSHPGVMADSALAMFLLGLAVGVPLGVCLFFGYLVMREMQETEQDRQMEELLASLEKEEETGANPWGRRGRKSGDSRQRLDAETSEENREPWERPSDWWREH